LNILSKLGNFEVAGVEAIGDPQGRLRRSSARARAISPGTENGLTT
jgi:hypothetical protein